MSDSAVTIAALAAEWAGALAGVYRILAVRTHVLFTIRQHKHPYLKSASLRNKSLRKGNLLDHFDILVLETKLDELTHCLASKISVKNYSTILDAPASAELLLQLAC